MGASKEYELYAVSGQNLLATIEFSNLCYQTSDRNLFLDYKQNELKMFTAVEKYWIWYS